MVGSGLSLSMSSRRSRRQSVVSRKSQSWPAGGRKAGTVAEVILHGGDAANKDNGFVDIFGSSPFHVGITHNPRDTRISFVTLLQEIHTRSRGWYTAKQVKGYRS